MLAVRQKFQLFINCVFQQIKLETIVFGYSDRKERVLDLKSEFLRKSKKSKSSQGVSACFLSKTRTFYQLCFSGQIKPEMIVLAYTG